MLRTRLIAYLLLNLIFAGVSIANVVEYKKYGFSISLSDGWVEIPRNILDAYETELAKLAPKVPAQHYDYGFQLDSSQNWFEYPYILIQVRNTGRIPKSQLEKIQGYSVQESKNKQKKNLSSMMNDMQAGEMIYDKETKIIWMRMESNVVDIGPIGPISGISGIVSTDKGFIQVSGYSLKNDYPAYESVFRSVAVSVTPGPELSYKSNWSDSLPLVVSGIDWGKVIGKGILGAIAAGIISLSVVLRKKKNEKKAN
jgi:hypothetical protein